MEMSQAVNLQQSVLHDIASLMGDNAALRKIYDFIQGLKNESLESQQSAEKEEILDDVRQGLIEMKLVKQGVIKSRPVEELLNEV